MTASRSLRAGLAAAAFLVAAPAVAHADAAGPTDFRTEIVAVEPPSDAFAVSIEGGDAFVLVDVEAGHEVLVLGYDGEPYLRIRDDGTVEQNRRSFATYYNDDRYGRVDAPEIVDPDAEPDWRHVGDGGRWAWHDHRAHWMDVRPPIGLEAGESLPADEIELVVDGVPTIVRVVTTLQPSPPWWPLAVGGVLGVLLVAVAILGTPAVAALAGGAVALVVGVAQYVALPPETGPAITWWLVPTLATLTAVGALVVGPNRRLARPAAVALSALFASGWAVSRRAVLTSPVLPTDLPFWADRALTFAVLIASIGVAGLAVRALLRPNAGHAAASA